jgi:hypothetical protein
MFEMHSYCKGCNKKLRIGYNGKTGFCRSCSQRGENNSMFGKRLPQETIEKNRIKQREASTLLWENEEYRALVITNSSKPRHEQFGIEQRERVLKWYEEHPEQRELRSTQMKIMG